MSLPTVTQDLDPPIRAHIKLPYCWVCKEPFIDEDTINPWDKPPTLMHSHHVVPQAAGGKNGPQVTICNQDHDLLHRIAEAWVSLPESKWLDPTNTGARLLAQAPPQRRNRLSYLAHVVARSLAAVADDPNKKVQVTLHLTAEENRQLIALQRIMRASRKGDVFLHLLRAAHRAQFALASPPTPPTPGD